VVLIGCPSRGGTCDRAYEPKRDDASSRDDLAHCWPPSYVQDC
jgi:hypothetical protein